LAVIRQVLHEAELANVGIPAVQAALAPGLPLIRVFADAGRSHVDEADTKGPGFCPAAGGAGE
jgi:hypothetical protein